MLCGTFFFAFASGTLTSIIANADQSNAKYTERRVLLSKISKEYNLPNKLYIEILQSIQYETTNNFDEVNTLLELLPLKLKTRVSLEIYKETYN